MKVQPFAATGQITLFHFISFHFFVRRSKLESSKRPARVTEETTATLRLRGASIDSVDETGGTKEKIKINEELGGSAGPLTWSADTSERRGKKKKKKKRTKGCHCHVWQAFAMYEIK